GAFFKFRPSLGPRNSAIPGGRSVGEEMAASAIADVPIVKVADPAIHLRSADQFRIVDHAGKNPRIVHAVVPEPDGQPMIPANAPRKDIEFWLGDATDVFGYDAEASHAFHVAFLAETTQFGEDLRTCPVFWRPIRTFFRSRGGS